MRVQISFNYYYAVVFKLASILVIIAHFQACGFWYLAYLKDFDETTWPSHFGEYKPGQVMRTQKPPSLPPSLPRPFLPTYLPTYLPSFHPLQLSPPSLSLLSLPSFPPLLSFCFVGSIAPSLLPSVSQYRHSPTALPVPRTPRPFVSRLILLMTHGGCWWRLQTAWDHYLTSLYWTYTTMSTTGYGDLAPFNDDERFYTLIMMVWLRKYSSASCCL